jgi:hypothetical protein
MNKVVMQTKTKQMISDQYKITAKREDHLFTKEGMFRTNLE